MAALVIAIDQATKAVVLSQFQGGRVVALLGGRVLLDLTANTGAAFGFFPNRGPVFVVIAVAVGAGVLVLRKQVTRLSLLERGAIGLILGGAFGNALDRVRLGYVVDFIDLRWWPVFNLADSAIVGGALLIALHSLLPRGSQ